jgi:hypothetical protein
MSCGQGNQNMQLKKRIEYYDNTKFNPLNYDDLTDTYTVDPSAYYAAPWPAERTQFDMNMQQNLSTADIPDFLNFRDTSPSAEVFDHSKPGNRPSMFRGQYYSYPGVGEEYTANGMNGDRYQAFVKPNCNNNYTMNTTQCPPAYACWNGRTGKKKICVMQNAV